MEKQQGKAGNLVKQLIHTGAVILDEPCYLTFPESGGLYYYRQSRLCRMVAGFWRLQDDNALLIITIF
jgi:hypothetical protein